MIRPARSTLRSILPLALVLLLVPALPARAAELDPVVQEVVHMLEGGVSEPVVASWLETSGRRPARVDAAELVALQKAKASDDLMKRLIRLANGAPAAPAAEPEGQPAHPAAAAPAPPSAVAPPALAPAAPAGSGPVRFRLAYRPFAAEEAAPPRNL